MPALTALDIVTLLLVGGAAALGLVRGFVTELLSLFAWVAGILALKFLHTPVTGALDGVVGTHAGAAVLAFALLFGVTFVAGKLVAAKLGARTRQSVIGPVDRALGLGFGMLKGLLAATLLFLLATLAVDTWNGASAPRPDWLRQSRTYPLLNATGNAVVDYVGKRRARAAALENGTDDAAD